MKQTFLHQNPLEEITGNALKPLKIREFDTAEQVKCINKIRTFFLECKRRKTKARMKYEQSCNQLV